MVRADHRGVIENLLCGADNYRQFNYVYVDVKLSEERYW